MFVRSAVGPAMAATQIASVGDGQGHGSRRFQSASAQLLEDFCFCRAHIVVPIWTQGAPLDDFVRLPLIDTAEERSCCRFADHLVQRDAYGFRQHVIGFGDKIFQVWHGQMLI